MAGSLSRRKIASYMADQMMAKIQLSELVKKLAAFLIDNKRTKELELIIRDIEYELLKRGTVLAQITSASELTDATCKQINDLIKDRMNADEVLLRQFVDPTVLGGVRIDLPGSQLDATIARRLTTLRTNYKK